MTASETGQVRLTCVEQGYAQVRFQPRDGAEFILGCVREAKHGSTRTGTMWEAVYVSGRVVGIGHTRAAAVEILVRKRT